MDTICPSNDVPDIIDSGGSKVNHPSNSVPDNHDVIDGDKPNLVMWLSQLAQPGGYTPWLSQWLHLMAQPGGSSTGLIKWLSQWPDLMAEPGG